MTPEQAYGMSPQVIPPGSASLVGVRTILVASDAPSVRAEVAGIAGTFISVPVLALARIIYLRIRKARLTARLASRPSPTHTVI